MKKTFGQQAAYVLTHPGAFALRVVRAFRANQGLLLAGAVAYYTLLSIVPLLILMLICLSQLIDQGQLLATLERYLEWPIPSQADAVTRELAQVLDHRAVIGWVLLATMVFFSSLAFTVLENAMSVIFLHRVAIRRRHFLISAVIPYCFIFFLGLGLLLMTLVSGSLQAIDAESVGFLGRIYAFGVIGEILVLTAIYLVMPVGRLSLRYALIGGITATVLWEVTRHVLVWYFGTLSQVNVVYGSLTTAIVVLLSLDIMATLLLFGAQVIAEYERIGTPDAAAPPRPLRTRR